MEFIYRTKKSSHIWGIIFVNCLRMIFELVRTSTDFFMKR